MISEGSIVSQSRVESILAKAQQNRRGTSIFFSGWYTTECRSPPAPLCQSKKAALTSAKKYCSKKTRHYWFLLFLLLIPLGVGIVWLSKLQKHYVEASPAYGAVEGTATEVGMVASLIRAFK